MIPEERLIVAIIGLAWRDYRGKSAALRRDAAARELQGKPAGLGSYQEAYSALALEKPQLFEALGHVQRREEQATAALNLDTETNPAVTDVAIWAGYGYVAEGMGNGFRG